MLMAELGHDHFAIIGHDRGGLIAFRTALDYPDCITPTLASSTSSRRSTTGLR